MQCSIPNSKNWCACRIDNSFVPIGILPTEKGNAVVIKDKDQCNKKLSEFVSSGNYSKLNKHPKTRNEWKVCKHTEEIQRHHRKAKTKLHTMQHKTTAHTETAQGK
jgi:hypothetical protein